MSRLRAILAYALLLLLLGTPAGAFAQEETVRDLSQPGDYDVNNLQGWNGLSTLAALAEGSGLQVLQRQTIDWEELDSNDLLLLIYPTNHLDSGNLVTFIRNGGRVLIADDFGAGDSVLGKLGARRTFAVEATEYHDNHLFAPIAHPVGKHQLSRGVPKLTTNHPGAIRNLEGGMTSVFEFSQNETLVATGRIGAGRYVALADPSVLINRMLQFEGNLSFAINLLRYLARPGESDRMVILSGNIHLAGVPRNQHDDGTWRGGASVKVATVDRFLDELNRWLFTARSLRIVTVIFAVLLGLLAFFTLPANRQRPLDGSWTKPGAEELGHLTQTYESAGSRTNFLLPAAIQRDNVNTALELALNTEDPLFALTEQQLIAATHRMLGLNTSLALKDLLPKLRNIPQRAQAASHWEPRFLGRAEFETIHHTATRLFDQLAATEEET
jgi:hypothetical protein